MFLCLNRLALPPFWQAEVDFFELTNVGLLPANFSRFRTSSAVAAASFFLAAPSVFSAYLIACFCALVSFFSAIPPFCHSRFFSGLFLSLYLLFENLALLFYPGSLFLCFGFLFFLLSALAAARRQPFCKVCGPIRCWWGEGMGVDSPPGPPP